MERNREARRSTNMAAPSNGLSSSRRRHRSSNLRDSPDEDGGLEVQEAGRLRERGAVKKERGDRDRERELSSRSKRRRESRMMIHQGSNRDDGDDTSDDSVNDEEEDDDDAGNSMRMLPPPPANPSTSMTSNHHSHGSYSQQLHHRKSFPSSGSNKVFRASAAASPPVLKAADEMIGVTVPRKARSASTKRSHEWVSGGGGVVGGAEQNHRQSSTSPVRLASSTASPAPLAPPSPSSSNASVRKKMKANGWSKPRPPKSSAKSSSSNPEELEIEIAEVLYGLMTQSQAPSKKELPSNDSTTKFDSNETKSRVTSPVANSTALPQNASSLSTIAPKRKKPRQVSEIDHHQHHQSPKTEISSSYMENSSPASAVAAENGESSFGFTTLQVSMAPSSEPSVVPLPQQAAEDEGKCGVRVVLTKEEAVGVNVGNSNSEAAIKTAALTKTTDLKPANPETERQKEGKFEIDLMAPPPQLKTSQDSDGDMDLSNQKQMPSSERLKIKEDDKLRTCKEEKMILTEVQKKSMAGSVQETGEPSKQAMNEERNVELHIDFEKPSKDSASPVGGTNNRSVHQALKHPQLSSKSEIHTEKTAQPSSLPVPMSVGNWPPMGYVAPLQGVISMDGNTLPSAPIQPLFTHPRPKRCATHCYIARNINYLQQLMKINPFWPAASGPAAPMFGAKQNNINGMPSTELHANIPLSMQDKGQPVGSFPVHTTGKETKSSQTTSISDPAQRKQQVLLQQAIPPVTSNNILHGPAFIFPFNQQQAMAASASVRPGSSKLSSGTATGGLGAASGAANSATVSSSTTAVAAPALSFNYPSISANETQYLAIVQNHPYAFPIPAVGAPPNYKGSHPHAQAMPIFNGSFYPSQMMHPSQIPQLPQQAPTPTQPQQTRQNSSGSTSSSQKHLQAQQRQEGSAVAANGSGSGSGGGLHNSHSAVHKSLSQQPSQHMSLPAQARHLEKEVTGGEDSPSTADSRVSRAATNTMGVYGQNFALPGHAQSFAMMYPQAASANTHDKKQQPQQQSQQQVLKRVGAELPSLPPQTFAMSFAPMNGSTGTISSMAQNHAIFQSLPESLRQSYQHMMASPAVAASAHHSEQKKDFRISEEATRTTGHESSNAGEDRKGSTGLATKSGQSIAFSRPDLATGASGSSAAAFSGTSVIDSSSARNINLGSNNRSTRSAMSTSVAATVQSSHHLHAQFQQQQQQHQSMNARSKNPPPSSNGAAYPEHLITSSSSMAVKFPNSLSFPLQTSNTNSSPVQSPQWRNSVRGPTTNQVPSSLASATTSSLKYLHQTQQQQSSRSLPQSHTQISFGAAAASPKLQSTTSSQMMQQQQQQQQQQNQNPSSNSGNQCASPPMLVGSPTNSFSSSQPKNTLVGTQRSSPSILCNPHNSTSTKSQQQQQQVSHQQLHKQTLQQQQAQAKAYAQMMYTQPYIVQPPQAHQHSAGSSAGSGYNLPRKQQQQQQSSQQHSSSSTAMLSLCPPVTLANTTTSDPAKAIAAATSNLKGGVGLASQQGILHAPSYGGNTAAAPSSMPAGFPQYVHNASAAAAAAAAAAAVQVKPAEQKQPADETL